MEAAQNPEADKREVTVHNTNHPHTTTPPPPTTTTARLCKQGTQNSLSKFAALGAGVCQFDLVHVRLSQHRG